MAFLSTNITPTPTPQSPNVPVLNAYEVPDVETVKPTYDAKKTGYTTPKGTAFTERDINTGLLDFTPTASKDIKFEGREVDSDSLGIGKIATTPTYNAGKSFIDSGSLVENRMKGLLDPNNDLNKQVLGQTAAQMQARGMVNSSIGATAGQSAMIDNALKIATPDAATLAQADLSRQTATYGSQRANQDTTNQGALAQQTAEINSALSAQNAGQAWDLQEKNAALEGDLNTQKAKIAGEQATQAAGYNADAAVRQGLLEGAAAQQQGAINAELKSMDSQSAQNLATLQAKLEAANNTTSDQNKLLLQQFADQQEMLRTVTSAQYTQAANQANLNSQQRQQLSTAMTTMANNYEISIQNIMLDPNLNAAAKNARIAQINKIFNDDMDNIAKVFGATYRKTTPNNPATPTTPTTPTTTTTT